MTGPPTSGVLGRALLAQLLAAASVLACLDTGILPRMSGQALAGLDGAMALLFSGMLRLPSWWLPIQALFVPAALFSLRLALPPWIWLVSFLLLWLIYRSNPRERVPLYLTDHETWNTLAALLPAGPFRFIDLGCGLGGGLALLAEKFPSAEFHGIESAPLPYLLGRCRLRDQSHCRIALGDFWEEDLARYDVVYAFLSPEPMLRLWRKASTEMRPGSLFVSNGFEVPGIEPDRLIVTSRGARLLVWRMPVQPVRTGTGAPPRTRALLRGV